MRRILVPPRLSEQLPAPGSHIERFAGTTMGTSWSVQVLARRGQIDPTLETGIIARLDKVVAEMSHWLPSSDLSRFNRANAGSWHCLPPNLYKVLACAARIAKSSGGAFDPYAGALVNLWGFGPVNRYDEPHFAPPTAAAASAARDNISANRVRLDSVTRSAWQPGDIHIDLSAIAKGFAVDQVADYLLACDRPHFLVEVGGELRGEGMKPDHQPWWVELEGPPGVATEPTAVALHGLSVATSGDYRRSYQLERMHLAHTIDPRSGRPIDNGVASVTVIHPECMYADAYSTALTVLGHVEGMAYAELEGVAARFLVHDGGGVREYISSHFEDLLG